jgi:prophage regulatory protein
MAKAIGRNPTLVGMTLQGITRTTTQGIALWMRRGFVSGCVTWRPICGAPGAPQSARDRGQPSSKLSRFGATSMKRNLRIQPRSCSRRRWRSRCHEAGPVETEPAHDESGQRIQLNAGLAGLEADDRVGRDASSGREGLQADALALPKAAGETRDRLAIMQNRKRSSTGSSPTTQTEARMHARDTKRLAGKREELIGVVYELYGRCNEVVLRVQDDVRPLVDLQRETTELLYILRSLPSEGRLEQVSTAAAAAPTRDRESRLPRLLPFREVAHRVALSRSTIWRMERAGQFPKRRRVSVNKVAWWEPEIEEWLRGRVR